MGVRGQCTAVRAVIPVDGYRERKRKERRRKRANGVIADLQERREEMREEDLN